MMYEFIFPLFLLVNSVIAASVNPFQEEPCLSGWYKNEYECKQMCAASCSPSASITQPSCTYKCPYAPTFTDFQLSCGKNQYKTSKECDAACSSVCQYELIPSLNQCRYQCSDGKNSEVIVIIILVVIIIVLTLTCFICMVHPSCFCAKHMQERKATGSWGMFPRAQLIHDGPATSKKAHPNQGEGPANLPDLHVPVEPRLKPANYNMYPGYVD